MYRWRYYARVFFFVLLAGIILWPGTSFFAEDEKEKLRDFVGTAVATKALQNAQPKPHKISSHIVQPGENLTKIASLYGTDIETLKQINELSDNECLKPGQVLTVVNFKGALHTVVYGDTLWELSREYGVSVEEILKANNLTEEQPLKIGMRLMIPGGVYKTFERSGSRGFVSGGRACLWPAAGRISSGFGQRWGRLHQGIDIAAPEGTPIYAAQSGKVVFAGWKNGYGKTVIIDHGRGFETLYGHARSVLVEAGQQVSKGQIIAKVGNTGRSTGPHLHFEVRVGGKAVDPLKFYRGS